MADIWMMLGLMLVAITACAAAGYLTTRRLNRSVAVVLAGLISAGMLVAGKYLSDSVFVAGVVPARFLPIFGNWLPMMAGLLVGVGWVLSHRSVPMKVVVLGMLLVAAMYLPYRPLFEERPQVRNRWTRSGVCLQTTGATCSAAASATLLNAIGIETSEKEMAELCFSTWRGTSLHGLLRGISEKLKGTPWRVRAAEMSKEDLARLKHPAILMVGLDELNAGNLKYVKDWGWIPGVEHSVVLFRAGDGRLDIGDPSTGRESWRLETLDVLWRGVAIVIERD